MAVSAFRSTSKRTTTPKPSPPTPNPRPNDAPSKNSPIRRSRSASAAPRRDPGRPSPAPAPETVNTRTNPLFDRTPAAGAGVEGSGGRRGRPASRSSDLGRGPARGIRRAASMGRFENSESEGETESSSSLSLAGRGGEFSELTRNLERWTARHPAGDAAEAARGRQWEDASSSCSFSDVEEGTVTKAVWRKSSSVDNTGNSVDIVPQLVIPDGVEFVSDIRSEYAKRLEQSQERARRLRVDLAIEELREQELSRILQEGIADKKTPETQKSQPKRKTSIERLKISRCLAEEAMAYFDECVSLSTFDSDDFSTPEDQQLSGDSLFDTNKLFATRDSNILASVYANGRLCNNEVHHMESNNCTNCSFGTVNSQQTDSSSSSGGAANLGHEESSNEVPADIRKPQSSNSCIPLSSKATETVGIHAIKGYVASCKKKRNEGLAYRKRASSYSADEYDQKSLDESFLYDRIMYSNRIESGSLLLCSARIF